MIEMHPDDLVEIHRETIMNKEWVTFRETCGDRREGSMLASAWDDSDIDPETFMNALRKAERQYEQGETIRRRLTDA